jgi:hypothetical protein
MPYFNFKNTVSEEVVTHLMSSSEKEEFLKNNPEFIQVLTVAPAIGDSVRLGVRKIDNGFNDTLLKVKSAHHKSIVNTK